MNNRILLTGAAGFIGYHAAMTLLARGDQVLGYDNLNTYYTTLLKKSRTKALGAHKNFTFVAGDVTCMESLKNAFDKFKPTHVLHLAAQAGVRFSVENPGAYISSNLVGFHNVIEQSRNSSVRKFIYASSSSVYGQSEKTPFVETDKTATPASLYAATKLANEHIAYAYMNTYGLPCTGLRFFTVYGPSGRPDMAYFKFANLIQNRRPIPLFNSGDMVRDFTHISDIVSGIVAAMDSSMSRPVYNLGRGKPETLRQLLQLLEFHMGISAIVEEQGMQTGDVTTTSADIALAQRELGYYPSVNLEVGIASFCEWHRRSRGLLENAGLI